MLRVGFVSYTNTYPLFRGLTSGSVESPFELIAAVPTEVNAMLRKGEIDVGFTSSYEYLLHQELYDHVEPFCLAAYDRLSSVTFHHRVPLEKMRRVGLIKASATASALVRVLCERLWGADPEFAQMDHLGQIEQFDGFLLIGDPALAHPHFEGYEAIDLAATWFAWTGKPMVFALMTARKGANPEEIALLQRQLFRSLDWFKMQSYNDDYFRQMHYLMGEEEREGLERFGALALEEVAV